MFKAGDEVQVKTLDKFSFAEYYRGGSKGTIFCVDHKDETVLVQFNITDRIWFRPSELEKLNEEITTVGQAIDFLVKAGYKVTIEKE
jgi:hypothetical protein